MIRTTIQPADTDVHILIPDNYVGKKLEVLLFAVDEPIDLNADEQNTMAAFKGILSKAEASELQEFVKNSREEWNTDI